MVVNNISAAQSDQTRMPLKDSLQKDVVVFEHRLVISNYYVSGRLLLGDDILRILQVFLQPL